MNGALLQRKNLGHPFILKCYDEGIITDIDLLFAQAVLKRAFYESESESAVFFLTMMMFSFRRQDLCVPPDIHEYLKEAISGVDQDFLNECEQCFVKGKKLLQSSAISNGGEGKVSMPVVEYNGYLYLQKNWLYETKIVDQIHCLLVNKPSSIFCEKTFVTAYEDLKKQQLLTDKQSLAISGAFASNFSIIYGGPGTGKTYVASHIIALFAKCFTPKERAFHVFVAAPTGKAASHLLSKVHDQITDDSRVHIEAMTLHSLLGMRKGERKTFNEKVLMADLVIIDETSMMDMTLMAYLLDSLSAQCHLILLGDPAQLPPVKGSSIFAEMIESIPNTGKQMVFDLDRCMRTDVPEIMALADKINREEGSLDLHDFVGSVRFIDRDTLSYEETMESFSDKFFRDFINVDINLLRQRQDHFRILSSVKKGRWGVERVNERIFEALHAKLASNDRMVVPIIVRKNIPALNLYNGTMGYVFLSSYQSLHDAKAHFFDGEEVRTIAVSRISHLEMAYCLSIHKSQGSEFSELIVILPKTGEEHFGKELLYTAITRAKKKLDVVGNMEEIEKIARRKQRKCSFLGERIATHNPSASLV